MAKSFDTSLKNVAAQYLKLLEVKITSTTIKKDVEEHPYYPSLLSLSDSFLRYNIENDAFQLDATNFLQLQPPFIAFVNMPIVGKDFVLVKKIKKDKITYLHKNSIPETVLLSEFLKNYQNVVWLAEPNESNMEEFYVENLKKENFQKFKFGVWVLGFIALILLFFGVNMNSITLYSYSFISIIKSLGVATSILLLIYEVDKNNAMVRNICSAGSKTNCDAILGSSAAKLLGISWSEIGFFYFSTTILWLLYPSISYDNKIMLVAIANVIVVPYIFFSIFFQYKIAKQWCPLCLAIQGLLVLELCWSFVFYWTVPHFLIFNTLPILEISICILLPIIAWYAIKPIIIKANDYNKYTAAYRRLQNNKEIFSSLLLQQPKAAEGWKNIGITLGNLSESTTIIKVCNPFCGPCAKAHPVLEQLVKANPKLQVKIIFTSTEFAEDKSAAVAKHLLALAANGDIIKTQQALDDWYLAEKKEYEVFAAKYPMDGDKLNQQNEMIYLMRDWCTKSDITYTPTIFINGYLIPDNYGIEDLKDVFKF
jgi:uncharacterized membrane protein/thiol-disulfide isomerase/thioredoxin